MKEERALIVENRRVNTTLRASGSVKAGVATATVNLPAGTADGMYTLEADYGHATDFAVSSDSSEMRLAGAAARPARSSP